MTPSIENILLINCQRVEQNNVEFYVGKLRAEDLCSIVSVTHRIITGFDDDNQPIYNEKIQRKPSSTRVNSIKDYLLHDEVASFPNNILVSVPSTLLKQEINEDNNSYQLKIDRDKVNLKSQEKPMYVQIIDGQHRFRGMEVALEQLSKEEDYDKLQKLKDFEFIISFFIDPEIDFQAMLFSVINRTPVKVSQDLVYDLFGLIDKDSPQKTALAITLELNGLKKTEAGNSAPFYKRIRLLGKKEKGESSPISQGMFVKTLIKLICPSIRKSEIERFVDRAKFQHNGTSKTIFREYYAKNRDNLIFRVFLNYFIAVRETFVDENGSSYWDIDKTPDNALQKTIGFLALVDVLIELFPIGKEKKQLTVDFFKIHLRKAQDIKLLNEAGETNYVYTSSGKTKLKEDLFAAILT